MNNEKRLEIFRRFKSTNETPTTELIFNSTFELLIAVILSAQSTDKGVNKATAKLFSVANTPQAILQLGEDGLKTFIKTIGFYNSKAKNIIGAVRILIEKHGGQVPANRELLEELPGVGRKTANVILNTVFGHATIAVDTHVYRVSNRTGLAPGKYVEDVEKRLAKYVPDEYKQNAHHWLILHGRYICIARKPLCWKCTIADLCDYKFKTPDPEVIVKIAKKNILIIKTLGKKKRKMSPIDKENL